MIAVDISTDKLELMKRLGATHTVSTCSYSCDRKQSLFELTLSVSGQRQDGECRAEDTRDHGYAAPVQACDPGCVDSWVCLADGRGVDVAIEALVSSVADTNHALLTLDVLGVCMSAGPTADCAGCRCQRDRCAVFSSSLLCCAADANVCG